MFSDLCTWLDNPGKPPVAGLKLATPAMITLHQITRYIPGKPWMHPEHQRKCSHDRTTWCSHHAFGLICTRSFPTGVIYKSLVPLAARLCELAGQDPGPSAVCRAVRMALACWLIRCWGLLGLRDNSSHGDTGAVTGRFPLSACPAWGPSAHGHHGEAAAVLVKASWDCQRVTNYEEQVDTSTSKKLHLTCSTGNLSNLPRCPSGGLGNCFIMPFQFWYSYDSSYNSFSRCRFAATHTAFVRQGSLRKSSCLC